MAAKFRRPFGLTRAPLLTVLVLTSAGSAHGKDVPSPTVAPLPMASVDEKPTEGRPTIVLDRLDFPRDVIGADGFSKHLKRSLARETRRAAWGAGAENRIEYRFSVTRLKYTIEDGALRISCAAVGKLPGGQHAKSELTFGGSLGERDKLTKKVLDIVARGVVTRLAELERQRRGLL